MITIYIDTLTVCKAFYPPETLLKAAYHFLDQLYIHFEESDTEWIIHIQPKVGTSTQRTWKTEFENELIAQTVRRCISKQTHSLRELLLARAMASTMILEEDPAAHVSSEETDLPEDALQEILTNWFDRHA